MRVFLVKSFAKWAIKEGLEIKALLNAIQEIEAGLIDVNLGHGLIKKRIARSGAGKRDGLRTLVSFQRDKLSIFMYGFAKNQRENISDKELQIYRQLANIYDTLNQAQLTKMVETGHFIEVNYDK